MNSPWTEAWPETAAILEQDSARGFHVGGQICVSHRGKRALNASFGKAREHAGMRPDSLMLWLSSGKPLTAVCIAQLWEKGELHLDDPVARFIPEFAQAGKGAITAANLLTHTGGFRTADKIPPDTDWEVVMEKICATPLEPRWPVGQKAGYHISGSWFILGEIIQRITRQPFAEFLRESLLIPAGMADTWNGIPLAAQAEYGERIALMHNTAMQPPQIMPLETPVLISQPRPGSNTRGPISDLAAFYEMLCNGGAVGKTQLLREETVRLFVSPQRKGMHDQTFMHPMDWGYGFLVNSRKELVETMPYSFGRHASARTFGHGGAQSSCGFCDPENGLAVAWALNGMAGERIHNARARELNTAIYNDWFSGSAAA
jgi:CubicO group peptidase (beta-lactamase class C family)